MNAMKKILTLMVIGSVLIFTGCEKDDTVETLDKEDAVQTLEKNDEELKASLKEIESTEGMQAIQTLEGLTQKDDPFSDETKSGGGEIIIENLQKVLRPTDNKQLKREGSYPFDFDNWVGTYEWQDTKEWNVKREDPDDQIIIKFPTDTTQESPENNAVLTLTDYSEFETTDSLGNTVYVADTVKMTLEIDGKEVLNVDYALDYDNELDAVQSLEATVYLKPFTWELSMSEEKVEAALINENNGNVLVSFSFEITFRDNMEDVEKLNGYVQFHNLRLDGGIKPYNLQRLEDETFLVENELTSFDDMVEYVNEQIDISLYKADTGNKIADMKVILDEESEDDIPVQPVLVFEDGSEEPAGQYFENVSNYIKSILETYNLEKSKI